MSRVSFVAAALEGKVLDVGHAVGPLHDEIAKGRSVTAIDITVKTPKKGVVKADAIDMPFKCNVFDSVLAGELIEHIIEPHLFLQEARRVLKGGGLLVLTTPNRKSLINRMFKAYEKPAHLSLFSKEELFVLLQEHGFQTECYRTFPYTQESSEGSSHAWFYPVRRLMHYLLLPALKEQMVFIARLIYD